MQLETVLRRLPGLQSRYNIFTHHINKVTEINDPPRGKNDALKGLLAAVKDNISTKNFGATTCSSRMLKDYKAPYDATVVNLLRDSRAVILGKTNMDEFAMGASGLNNGLGGGPVINPISDIEDYCPGGSSSGSAAAVLADLVDFALGTDTGGSVRLPAAWGSILGFKPSYGRISRFGVIDFAQSLDTVGILAKDIGILRKVFSVLDKYDPRDPTSLTDDLRDQLTKSHITVERDTKPKIGIPKEFSLSSLTPEMRQHFLTYVGRLMSLGYEVYPVSVPSIKHSLIMYYILAPAEAASNLARYDGIRYGSRSIAGDMDEHNTLFGSTRAENFGPEVQKRIILGNYNLCSASYKNNFIKAQKLRVQLIDEFDNVFNFANVLTGNRSAPDGIDFILSPTNIGGPKTIKEETSIESADELSAYATDVFTTPMSLAGLPALSIPVQNGTPLGIQIAGQYGDDQRVLDFAASLYQQNT
ncbi:glutamyl-tRNA(Gln) amidotransferase subunit HER2 KNAG_0E01490 [Huiozyma naganishii CBS 8797]|uniref:Glutamyl-tRNA(Gln) amidotransferase subunit A, mitochondrial n=1 Tax=Huiozyma naganishii (strain ATCC MYA-139 / BCRC 22969 / CBS 8797 / KCTC 17520 / NBRC 10181 / NCYC 3082 / Yp74L-3) TaxID=1071383 RepID=J7RLK4_HUIN7|nr:hypothetical protein KNAG_0E01490 [Kazachstania naganishii CBS 8797]CCK70413.1 hypothetical protein KNAG_0E01490 [Kazachstania naganishii CBS 8797]